MFDVDVAQNLVSSLKIILSTQSENIKLLSHNEEYPNECNIPTLYSALHINGYRVLGNGYFSIVVEHYSLPNYVIKLGLKKEDSGAAYAAYCRARPNHKHLPKIELVDASPEAYFVCMPKYECLQNYQSGWSYLFSACWDVLAEDIPAHMLMEIACEHGEPALWEAIEIIEYFQGLATLDMHSENCMFDPVNKCIIFTDPVSFTRT